MFFWLVNPWLIFVREFLYYLCITCVQLKAGGLSVNLSQHFAPQSFACSDKDHFKASDLPAVILPVKQKFVSCLYITLSKLLTCSRVKTIENNKTKILTDMFHNQMGIVADKVAAIFMSYQGRKCTCKTNCCYCFHITQNDKSIDRQQMGLCQMHLL